MTHAEKLIKKFKDSDEFKDHELRTIHEHGEVKSYFVQYIIYK